MKTGWQAEKLKKRLENEIKTGWKLKKKTENSPPWFLERDERQTVAVSSLFSPSLSSLSPQGQPAIQHLPPAANTFLSIYLLHKAISIFKYTKRLLILCSVPPRLVILFPPSRDATPANTIVQLSSLYRPSSRWKSQPISSFLRPILLANFQTAAHSLALVASYTATPEHQVASACTEWALAFVFFFLIKDPHIYSF